MSQPPITSTRNTIPISDELKIRADHDGQRALLAALAEGVQVICEATLKASDFPYHSIKSRIKSIPSILEKIVRKKYAPRLDSLSDLVGVRVVCLYPDHIDPVIGILEKQFKIHEKIDKRPERTPDQFGYSSVHIICSLENEPRSSLPEYDKVSKVKFEIQVRTILQEAWAEIEHGLIYKNDVAVPSEVKRQITRVSALLEVADKEFQSAYDRHRKYVERLKSANTSSLGGEQLNLESLMEIIRRKFAWATGWEAVHGESLEDDVANLLLEMKDANITTAGQLIELIDKWGKQEYEESAQAFDVAIESFENGSSGGPYVFEFDTDIDWYKENKQYFLPVGQLRGILHKELESRPMVGVPQ